MDQFGFMHTFSFPPEARGDTKLLLIFLYSFEPVSSPLRRPLPGSATAPSQPPPGPAACHTHLELFLDLFSPGGTGASALPLPIASEEEEERKKRKKGKGIIEEQRDNHTPMFIASLFTLAKVRNQPKCSLEIMKM